MIFSAENLKRANVRGIEKEFVESRPELSRNIDSARKCAVQYERFLGARADRIQREVRSLAESRRNGGNFSPRRHDLAAYVFARQIVNRPINHRLPLLIDATDTVEDVRKIMKYGADNAGSGNVHILEASRRIRYAREYFEKHKPGTAFEAAAAMKIEAGNCQEQAYACVALHGKKLDSDGSISVVSSTTADHMWVEARSGRFGASIVMDPWCKGPAVMATDIAASFPRRQNVEISNRMGQADALKFSNKVEEIFGSKHALKKFEKGLVKTKAPRMVVSGPNFHAPSVLGEPIKAAVKEKLLNGSSGNDSSTPAIEKSKESVQGPPSNSRKFFMEIGAVHAARELGATIRRAVDASPWVIEALKRLIS